MRDECPAAWFFQLQIHLPQSLPSMTKSELSPSSMVMSISSRWYFDQIQLFVILEESKPCEASHGAGVPSLSLTLGQTDALGPAFLQMRSEQSKCLADMLHDSTSHSSTSQASSGMQPDPCN